MADKKHPNLDEAQWRIIYDALVDSTQIGAKPETSKERLAWYERTEIIQSIKAEFGFRERTKSKPDPHFATTV